MEARSLFANERETHEFLAALRDKAGEGSIHYIQVETRTKYGSPVNKILRDDTMPLDRVVNFVHSATPARGFYVKGEPIDNSGVVVYLTPEPRDCERAAKEVCAKFILGQCKADLGWAFKAEAQRHPQSRRILDVDVDDKALYEPVRDMLAAEGVRPEFVLETRGGYHFVCYDLTDAQQKAIYFFAKNLTKVDLLKNSMVPLPGTLQGGFEVKWLR